MVQSRMQGLRWEGKFKISMRLIKTFNDLNYIKDSSGKKPRCNH
jgi:hypothetical protein